jgi:uncharacterized DUF497 family protein
MQFTWNPRKRLDNLRKHGIDFVRVTRDFERLQVVGLDTRENYGEDRWIAMGYLGTQLIVVVYTLVEEDLVRIISARKTTRHEHKAFHRQTDG